MSKVNVLKVDPNLLSRQLRVVMKAADRRKLSPYDRYLLGGLEQLLSDLSIAIAEGYSAMVCENVEVKRMRGKRSR